MDVTLCSRSKDKAQRVVDSLVEGKGWTEDKCTVPPNKGGPDGQGPIEPTGWKIQAGTIKDAAAADVIALASPFHVMWPTLEHWRCLATLARGVESVRQEGHASWGHTSGSSWHDSAWVSRWECAIRGVYVYVRLSEAGGRTEEGSS